MNFDWWIHEEVQSYKQLIVIFVIINLLAVVLSLSTLAIKAQYGSLNISRSDNSSSSSSSNSSGVFSFPRFFHNIKLAEPCIISLVLYKY